MIVRCFGLRCRKIVQLLMSAGCRITSDEKLELIVDRELRSARKRRSGRRINAHSNHASARAAKQITTCLAHFLGY